MNRNVHLHIEGNLLERLLNRALQSGASLSRIRRNSKRAIIISTDEHSAAIIITLCEKYFLNCRILRRSGLLALREQLHRRWTLFPALLLWGTICALCLSRIWLIDVQFNGPRPDLGNKTAIISLLKESGIKPGIAARDIDSELLQKQMLFKAGNYSFFGVRRQGIRLLVEAAPEVPSPGIYQIGYARDLVASQDGVVESITVQAGTVCVKPGDTVRAGQTLIRGEETVAIDPETHEEITAPVNALGEVIARCWYEGSAEGYIRIRTPSRTGRKSTHVRLKLLNRTLPLQEGERYLQYEVEVERLPIVGLFFPLELERSTCFETRSSIHSPDPTALQAHLKALAHADAMQQLSRDNIQYQIASHWTDAQQNGNILRLRAFYEIYTDIAATRDALVEEVY